MFNDLKFKDRVLTQRTTAEIRRLILEAAQHGATKTSMMFSAYLSHAAIGEHIASLEAAGLLEYVSGEMKFKTTLEGIKSLSYPCSGKQLCNHQCRRCGGVYDCGEANCTKPFNFSQCNRCQEFPHFATPKIIETK